LFLFFLFSEKGRHQQEVWVTRAEGQGEGHHQNHGLSRGKRDLHNVEESGRNSTEEIFRNDQLTMANEGRKHSIEKKKKQKKDGVARKNKRYKKMKKKKRKRIDILKKKMSATLEKKKSKTLKKMKADTLKKEKPDTTEKKKSNTLKKKKSDTLMRRNTKGDTLKRKKQKSSSFKKKQSKHKTNTEKSGQKNVMKTTETSEQKLGVKKAHNINGTLIDDLTGKVEEKDYRNVTKKVSRGQRTSKRNKMLGDKIKKKTDKHNRGEVKRRKKPAIKGSKKRDHSKSQNKEKVVSGDGLSNKTKVQEEIQVNKTSSSGGHVANVTTTRKQSKHHRNNTSNKGEKFKESNQEKTKKAKRRHHSKTKKKKNVKKSLTKDQHHVGSPVPNEKQFKVRDCIITEWSDWSHCSVTCGRGLQFKRRIIEAVEKNGGKPCPVKLEMRRRCVLTRCPGELSMYYCLYRIYKNVKV